MFSKIAYRVTTMVIAIIFFVTGIGNLVPFDHIAHDMAHLGYPFYFLNILGMWKVFAGIIILIPKVPTIKEWAFAGMILDLSGAAFSRIAIGDRPETIIIPIVISWLVIINYILRHILFNKNIL